MPTGAAPPFAAVASSSQLRSIMPRTFFVSACNAVPELALISAERSVPLLSTTHDAVARHEQLLVRVLDGGGELLVAQAVHAGAAVLAACVFLRCVVCV